MLIFNIRKKRENKRGWIRIVEAFVALLLIIGTVLILINRGYLGAKDISQKVYESQLAILREIQVDDTLRAEILGAVIPTENGLESNEGGFPSGVLTKINDRTPNYLTCVAKICALDVICESTQTLANKDIYAQPVSITTSTTFDPRQLKLFCWTK